MLVIKKVLSYAGKNWKNIALILSVVIAFFSVRGCNDRGQRIKDLKAAQSYNKAAYNSELKKWKDQNNELHVEADNLLVEHFAVLADLDSISHLLSIKPKQVVSYSKTAVEIVANGKPIVDSTVKKVSVEGSDSIDIVTQYDFSWFNRDSTLHAWGTVGNGNDSVHVWGIDSLSRTDFWKRKWFLGAKQYYSDFHHSNNDIKTVGYTGTQIREKEKRWIVAIGGGFGYPFGNIQFKRPVSFFGVFTGYTLFHY
jgi:hypothetical protein